MRLSPLPFALLSLLAISPAISAPRVPDAIEEALAQVGWTRDDLGYRPKGYWNRFPDPAAASHKLRAFDDLFSEPLRSYDYPRTMANAAAKYLDPAFGSVEPEKKSDALYHLVYSIGVDRFVGGFRNFSPNLTAVAPAEEPLKTAIGAMYAYSGRDLQPTSFGATTAWPAEGSPDAEALKEIPLELQMIVARAIYNLLNAARWRDLALRNCDSDDLTAVFAIRDLGPTQGDGLVFYPAVADVAASIDWQSMAYSWLKATAAAGLLREEAAQWVASQPAGRDYLAKRHYEFSTPLGRIVIGDGRARSFNLLDDPGSIALCLDLGGNELYQAPVGSATDLFTPVAIAVDLGGDDWYGDPAQNAGFGTGIFGVGILWDAAGNDHYEGKTLALGAGQFGCGVLFDEGEGKDHYTAETSGQGCGYLGLGFCIDGGGDDKYTLSGGEGQGFGGIGGIGVCIDRAGNDTYFAEPDATKAAGRADYHSAFAINVSNAQGVGSGRRGDGSDGHSWAGGMGAIIDLEGDDVYTSGNWSLGTGYWYGMGFAWDGGGNDVYKSVYFTQGSGAHFCIGALIDEGDGDDTHLLEHTAGAALGFGWDFTNALFVDGGGDDRYSAKLISYGCAEIRSNAFFLELGGDDTYEYTPGLLGFGAVDWRDDYAIPGPMSTYMSDAGSVGLFLDFGGDDKYVPTGELGETLPLPMANGASWLIPEAGSSHFGWENYGVGVDQEGGGWDERDRWSFTFPSAE